MVYLHSHNAVGHLQLPHFFFNLNVSTMSNLFPVNVLEQCRVTPPPNTTPTTTLPLTFFDLPFLFFCPSQPLFFYEFPHPMSHFISTTLPKLKHSLSLTLEHYYPFAGTLIIPSHEPAKPHLVCTESKSISLTIAESNGDFKQFCTNHPRDVNIFHSLVPKLASPSLSCVQKELPLLAIQVTTFPDVGISIGLAFHHVVADGRTINNFFNTWAWYCNFGASSFPLESLPFHDRSIMVDAKSLEEIFLKEYWRERRLAQEQDIAIGKEAKADLSNMVRATFLMDSTYMENIKLFILDKCKKKNQPLPLRLSPFVLTCAFLWVCLLKAQQSVNKKMVHEDPTNYFGFIAGGITRLDFPVPITYLGNCVGFGRISIRTKELLGEDGIVIAAREMGKKVKKLDASFLAEAEKWVLDWEVLHGSEHHVHAIWSPKLKLYESDFGWGRPKKIEEISIDYTRAVSLLQSRDAEGGIEIGLALPQIKMDAFSNLFREGLNALA